MIRRHGALVDPENLDARPVDIEPGEHRQECARGGPSRKGDDEFLTPGDHLRGVTLERLRERRMDFGQRGDNDAGGHAQPPPTRLLASVGPPLPQSYTNSGLT